MHGASACAAELGGCGRDGGAGRVDVVDERDVCRRTGDGCERATHVLAPLHAGEPALRSRRFAAAEERRDRKIPARRELAGERLGCVLRALQASLGIARHEGKPIAAQFWTVENGVAYIHKLAHLEEAKPLSAGTVLTAALMAQVIDRDRATLVDFGTGDAPPCTRPTTIGRSGSPPKNPTSTSCPIRGTVTIPYPPPAHPWLTRNQHELPWSNSPSRSQWNCTRTRPNSSVWISCPDGPTTTALSTPCARGFGVVFLG